MLKVIGCLLLFTLTFLHYLYFHQFYNDTLEFLPGRANQDRASTHNDTIKYNISVKLRRTMHRGRSRVNDFSRDPECTMAPDSRFDCARDKAVSQSECEQRGCCYAPGSDSAGPPWCFYPGLYRGYRMGPLVPTLHGLTASLTRAAPSYLPRDILVLQLDVTEEATDCLRITVSNYTVSVEAHLNLHRLAHFFLMIEFLWKFCSYHHINFFALRVVRPLFHVGGRVDYTVRFRVWSTLTEFPKGTHSFFSR